LICCCASSSQRTKSVTSSASISEGWKRNQRASSAAHGQLGERLAAGQLDRVRQRDVKK